MIIHKVGAGLVGAAVLAVGLALLMPWENPAMANDGKTVTVTEKDNGSKISLNKGDLLVVRLEAQSGTAYLWDIGKNDAAVLKPQGKREVEKPEKPVPGGKVTHVFRLKAAASGDSTLELNYRRPFDKEETKSAKTFKISVSVK